jgi:hypothetical protein
MRRIREQKIPNQSSIGMFFLFYLTGATSRKYLHKTGYESWNLIDMSVNRAWKRAAVLTTAPKLSATAIEAHLCHLKKSAIYNNFII